MGLTSMPFPRGQQVTAPAVQAQLGLRTIEAVLTLGIFPNSAVIGSVEVRIVEPPSDREVRELPPLLGRDILSRFALFLEERTNRVFLLEPHEADALDFPQ